MYLASGITIAPDLLEHLHREAQGPGRYYMGAQTQGLKSLGLGGVIAVSVGDYSTVAVSRYLVRSLRADSMEAWSSLMSALAFVKSLSWSVSFLM